MQMSLLHLGLTFWAAVAAAFALRALPEIVRAWSE